MRWVLTLVLDTSCLLNPKAKPLAAQGYRMVEQQVRLESYSHAALFRVG